MKGTIRKQYYRFFFFNTMVLNVCPINFFSPTMILQGRQALVFYLSRELIEFSAAQTCDAARQFLVLIRHKVYAMLAV